MKACLLFPGQGAQYVGMGKDFHATSTEAREIFGMASEISKLDLKKLIFDGTEDDLRQTRVTQIALATVESAAASCIRSYGTVPAGAAGFSLGEWPALVEAGFLDLATMLRLVSERGRLMAEACERSSGSGMAAVMGLEYSAIEAALKEAGIDDIWIANLNSPGQTVVSGTESGLGRIEAPLKAAGARRVIRLKVSGAFHSPLMQYAYDGFRELLADVEFKDAKIPFYSNVTGGLIRSGAEAKRRAAEQIIHAVRWADEQNAVLADGYEACLEAGPGSVLCGLWKGVTEAVPCHPCGTVDQIARISL
ncbi:MAG TPA: ACP S-malonyltransferase [Magnetospirillaceae bacterium]|nr:ACP S-malonyltransferase [Magnetospirillaceae bacterium]